MAIVIREEYKRVFIRFLLISSLIIWIFCIPPKNKIAQICLWWNNIRYYTAIITEEAPKEYLYYRNKAIFLAKMYPNNKDLSIKEINTAIKMLPKNTDENILNGLYKDRAYLYLYYKDYKNSLNDFIRAKNSIDAGEYITVALLLIETDNLSYAKDYCNMILRQDYTAIKGYACLAYLYEKKGDYDKVVNTWDLGINNTHKRASFYIEKALAQKRMGDINAYEEYIEKTRNISIKKQKPYAEKILNPKTVHITPKYK